MEPRKYKITFLADSNPTTGGSNLREKGSVFDVVLDRPMIIPRKADNISLVVKNASIWWTVPNIGPDLGNNVFIYTKNNIEYRLELGEGLYSLTDLDETISLELQAQSEGAITADEIRFEPVTAENKVAIILTEDGASVDFTQENSLRFILGFEAEVLTKTNAGADEVFIGENVAAFNTISYFLIACPTLLSRGLNFNSSYRGIMARVPIDVSPGSLINYDPRQSYAISANELAGGDFTRLTFQLLDNSFNMVNTLGEYWSVLFEITYEIPIV